MRDKHKKILVIIGTRPEAIKVAPLFFKNACNYGLDFLLYTTGQHIELLESVLEIFSLKPYISDKVMSPNQQLEELTAILLTFISKRLEEIKPDYVLVQGDTSTAFCGALAAFYKKIKVIHLEAGLRTNDKHNPFPEELNRSMITRIADFHFAPSDNAVHNIQLEGINHQVYNVGNTVIDALLFIMHTSHFHKIEEQVKSLSLPLNKSFILVTGHRRENFGQPMKNVFLALKKIALEGYPIIFPVHLNPNVRQEAAILLQGTNNIHLIEPVDYPTLLYLLSRCSLVITDSGGIQEEASFLGKPLLITRETTERPEVLQFVSGILAGTDTENIYTNALHLLNAEQAAENITQNTLYGKGNAAEKIFSILSETHG